MAGEIIDYNDQRLTDVEREDWFIGGYEGYNWHEIYESRIISLANEIVTDTASVALNLPIEEKNNRLVKATINYLLSLSKDWYTKKEINKLLKV